MWLPLTHPLLGTWPTTRACGPAGNQTRDPLLHRPALNLLSHTSQGRPSGFKLQKPTQATYEEGCFQSKILLCGTPWQEAQKGLRNTWKCKAIGNLGHSLSPSLAFASLHIFISYSLQSLLLLLPVLIAKPGDLWLSNSNITRTVEWRASLFFP